MTALTADLLHALRAAGYHIGLKEDRLVLQPPPSGMSPALRYRIAEHRDALKALLRSDDPVTACTACDADLQAEEARRLEPDRLAAYLDRYAATGNAVDIAIAAWYATAQATQRHLAEHDHQMPPPDEPDPPEEMAPDSSWNDGEPLSELQEPPARLTIYVCAGCGLPRSRRPEPCPNCGALRGRNRYPNAEVA